MLELNPMTRRRLQQPATSLNWFMCAPFVSIEQQKTSDCDRSLSRITMRQLFSRSIPGQWQ